MNNQTNPNLVIYNAVRAVPPEAKKPIQAGRLKGMTDINPMWRIKALTDTFGPCGIGWWYTITSQRIEPLASTGEIAAFVDIDLYYRWNGETSQPIPGIGGSTFIASEKGGLHMDDEAFKKALTDAISVAAKALGVGADVYWEKDSTKYTSPNEGDAPPPQKQPITYDEALDYVLRDTVYQGQTLRNVYKTARRDVEIVYNQTQDLRAKEAITVIEGEIRKAKKTVPVQTGAPIAPIQSGMPLVDTSRGPDTVTLEEL